MSGTGAPTRPTSGRSICEAAAAWLAILSLLFAALLPSAVSIAAQSAAGKPAATCGVPPHKGGLGDKDPERTAPAPTLCCVLCLSAAIGTGPIPRPDPVPPPMLQAELQPAATKLQSMFRVTHFGAQPRGPPGG